MPLCSPRPEALCVLCFQVVNDEWTCVALFKSTDSSELFKTFDTQWSDDILSARSRINLAVTSWPLFHTITQEQELENGARFHIWSDRDAFTHILHLTEASTRYNIVSSLDQTSRSATSAQVLLILSLKWLSGDLHTTWASFLSVTTCMTWTETSSLSVCEGKAVFLVLVLRKHSHSCLRPQPLSCIQTDVNVQSWLMKVGTSSHFYSLFGEVHEHHLSCKL